MGRSKGAPTTFLIGLPALLLGDAGCEPPCEPWTVEAWDEAGGCNCCTFGASCGDGVVKPEHALLATTELPGDGQAEDTAIADIEDAHAL